ALPGRLEGPARGVVLHALEVRALESADHGDHPYSAGPDLPLGRDVGARLVALLELTKPRITQLVLLTAAAGFYLGSGAHVDVRLLSHTLFGVALVAVGTNAFNRVWECDLDARLRRTERRPLPSGRIGSLAAGPFAGTVPDTVGIVHVCVRLRVPAHRPHQPDLRTRPAGEQPTAVLVRTQGVIRSRRLTRTGLGGWGFLALEGLAPDEYPRVAPLP